MHRLMVNINDLDENLMRDAENRSLMCVESRCSKKINTIFILKNTILSISSMKNILYLFF